jgi:ABC-type multidrug transport system fused ATPase/permease subunit
MGSEKLQNNQERIKSVLKDLELDGFIDTLPKNLDTIIDEDTSLSGGQKQLLAVARTLLQQRPFLIFDEGSSQLDAEKEFLVMKQLLKVKREAGVLFITHRMSVARKADYIYVIDEGRIVQEGTHSELVDEKNGLYSKFWSLQMVD